MPRFYFELNDGGFSVGGDVAQEFTDLQDARRLAVHTLAEMARGLPYRSGDRHKIVAVVRDDAGRAVLTATLSLDVETND